MKVANPPETVVSDVALDAGEMMTVAFRATPRVIRALIPPRTIGAYVLFRGDQPIYIGRSDECLRERLARHQHLAQATHVMWMPQPTRVTAFKLEAAWYHVFGETADALNQIHPARPAGHPDIVCPFCASNDEDALSRALS